ncbi:uncharacterized protein LOC131158356 isoform X2 [Malania oleifera]|uniref:uncharacterized protein LOC131158356 isoform X2 n=1 Tax=Malania oleifera TaxID=397392 RepID=UPI0025AE8712|nr:uncharacterized protein LOC131158356 isoform X2 [Malania oleifera]
MPGTIQVSVLGFMDFPPSSPSSSVSVKVSIGKDEYQTWGKGDFSFPLTTLRKNLIVTLLDQEGNAISHTGIDTMLVVEKGSWEQIFPFEGGGHVHMKLQFILSEEERNQIRIMRESALKKKIKKYAVNIEEVAMQADQMLPNSSSKDSQYSTGHKEGTPDLKQAAPDRSQEAVLTASMPKQVQHQITEREFIEKIFPESPGPDASAQYLHSLEASTLFKCSESAVTTNNGSGFPNQEKDTDDRSEEISSSQESFPSNVRKMISALENSSTQNTTSQINPTATKSQSTTPYPIKALHLKENKSGKTKLAQRSSDMGELRQTSTKTKKRIEQFGFHSALNETQPFQDTRQLGFSGQHIQSEGGNPSLKNKNDIAQEVVDVKEERKSLGHLTKGSTIETDMDLGRTLNDHRVEHQLFSLHEKVSKEAANLRLKSVAYYGDSFESSGSWIFLDERARRLCITTCCTNVINLLGNCSIEATMEQKDMKFLPLQDVGEHGMHGSSDVEANIMEKTSPTDGPKLESATYVETSQGSIGQAIKIAIMVGFGMLVLLTRER